MLPLRTLFAIALLPFAMDVHAADDAARPGAPPWRVLILNGADVLIPFWLMIDPLLRDSIADMAAPRRVEFLGVALDLTRFPKLETDLVPLLRKKYSEQPVDLVMTVGAPALEFAKKYRDAIWHGAPIVFVVVPTGTMPDPSRSLNVTGVYYDFDVDGTITLMSRLQPQWNRLLVVGGSSAFDLAWNAHFLPHAEHVPQKVTVEYVNDRTPDELAALLARLPKAAAVLYTSISRDASGATHTPRDVAGVLARASSAPVYAMFPTMLGQGIVGGSMTSLEDEGAAAARLAVRVLRAGSANGIPSEPSPPARCLLDYSALGRWAIRQSAIPADCEVRFLPREVWRDYPVQFAIGTAAMLALATLVAALLAQRRQRHKAELAVESLRSTLFHASRLAAVGELTASIAHEINQPLAAILTNADTARLIAERDPSRIADVRRLLADIRADDIRAGEVIRRIRGLVTKREIERGCVGVNDVVSEVLALLRNEATRRNITLTTSLDPAKPEVLADRVQLQQVLLNLMINAMDAMNETSALKRVVEVSTAMLDDGSVELAVADRGHGIAAENFPRLFSSFWSTKPEGMGLGLNIVQSIVEAHSGSIRAESNEYGGATFRVVLPLTPAAGNGSEGAKA
jgi:signal transduction histidine kinase